MRSGTGTRQANYLFDRGRYICRKLRQYRSPVKRGGVPTYRGSDGIWVEGTRNYTPEKFGTFRFFEENPAEVWKFILYRKVSFRDIQPNPGHFALANIEKLLPNNFQLITQNVDYLHLKADNSREKVYEIHGNMETVRCSEECSIETYPFPIDIGAEPYSAHMIEEQWDALKCPHCDSIVRPNVLLFDEYYNERLYKQESAIETALNTRVLFIVGTTGTTNLPNQIASTAIYRGSAIVDINIETNDFSDLASDQTNGFSLQGKSGEILPMIEEMLKEVVG